MASDDEARELKLLDGAEWKIIQVSSDEERLQQTLKTFLAPIILKAASPSEKVRAKTTAVCQTINKLIQSPSIVLPVVALLDQYKSTDSFLVRYFDLTYINHSISRLDAEEQRAFVPKALRGIGSDSEKNAKDLFHFVLRCLPSVKIPPRGTQDDLAFREHLGLIDDKDAAFLAEWIGKLLLLSSSRSFPGEQNFQVPQALSESDVSFLTRGMKPEVWQPEKGGLDLTDTRLRALNLLASGAFRDQEKFLPAIYAAASSDSRFSSVGDDLIKRTSVSLEDAELVKSLFEAHAKMLPPHRIRILGLLSKSEVATTFSADILAVFEKNVPSDPMMGSISTGLELTKLHRALFEFINWVARMGSKKAEFGMVARSLLNRLREFVESQGWPVPDHQSLDTNVLRSRAYETMGIFSKCTPWTDDTRLVFADWLFTSLSEDPTPDVVVSIDGALSSLTSSFKPPHNDKVTARLQSITLRNMMLNESEDHGAVRSTRHAAVKWANHCLPFSDVKARWIDILAIAGRRDERSDVIEEGHKGLDPWTYYANDEKDQTLPNWQELTRAFFWEIMWPRHAERGNMDMDVDDTGALVNFPGDILHAFPVAVDYARCILFLSALPDFKFEPGWRRQLDASVSSDLTARRSIREYLSTFTQSDHELAQLLRGGFAGMLLKDFILAEPCARSFVEIASLAPKDVLETVVRHARDVLPLIKSNNKEIRSLAAKAFGILAAHPFNLPDNVAEARWSLVETIEKREGAVGAELNAVEGAFVALTHFASRLVYYAGVPMTDAKHFSGLSDVFPPLDGITAPSTQEALFEAYTQLWTAGVPTTLPPSTDITKAFIDPLLVSAKKGKEKAITALGRLALSLPDSEDKLLTDILEKLYALHEIKQVEIHFAVGEALAAAVARWDAGVVQLTVDVEAVKDLCLFPKRSDHVVAVLEKLIADCKTTKPSLLKASGIWLFCMIQHCSHLEEVQSRLRHCQAAFMRLLSARDELVQETASRGLSLVYEKGDADLKAQLVRDLVSSFTGSGPQLKVEQDTELFDAGALPTGEGKSVTSYKDIVSLANEVGDPSLVYKFMSLAANAATWSTRSAFGRFGLSNILSDWEVDPKLYPKLYRYRFDPSHLVQRSMNDIWKALVKDSNAVMEKYFDDIMQDLLKSVLGREWRVREASCAAIADLVSGKPFPKYEKYYKDIWAASLKVLDDVKATVRNAALSLCISLSKTLVRQLEDSGSSTTAKAMINEALPFLLSEKAIENSADDVKYFAIVTVLDIAKKGGSSLKNYIPTMVPHLLVLLSTVEPEMVTYHYQRIGEEQRERLDKARSSMVTSGPIIAAIEDCLRSVDADVMKELAPRLQETIKTALGMPTKIGCGRVVSTLASRHTVDFAPYVGSFLTVLEKQVLDKNDEVSSNYARTAAYLLRVASDSAKQKFAEKFTSLYLTAENETRRQKVSDVILSLSKISPDHFNALEVQLLPLAFLGKHDTDEYVSHAFKEVWDTHAGSSLTVIRLVDEIISLADQTLGTAQWALKHAGALAIGSAVGLVGDASYVTGHINVDMAKKLWPVYDRALLLKTFPDKDKLLEPYPGFVKRAKTFWEADPKVSEQMKKVAVREAKRNNDEYRPHAFRCLWRFAEVREDLDLLDEITTIVSSFLEVDGDDADADKMDVDDAAKETAQRRKNGLDLRSLTQWAAVEAIVKGYNRPKMQSNPFETLRGIATALQSADPKSKTKGLTATPYIAREEFSTIRRTHWYDSAKEVLNEAAATKKPSSDGKGAEVVKWFLATFDLASENTGTELQRTSRAKAVQAVIQLAKTDAAVLGDIKSELKSTIEEAVGKERSLEVQKVWKECLGLR
ncbi:proteasome component ECM29 [Podospora australis]|uniref:Proteasome component ECM29 n=1 Tax=Podospora australis TaxID=1536484 RepID=A0AAN6WMT6_9PEZI|nr:proteasome component ECM29 [Podospora australis]